MSEETTTVPTPTSPAGGNRPLMVFAWIWVGLPFTYGVYALVLKVTDLFAG